MKKPLLICLLVFFAGVISKAQEYWVPDRMTVAGIRLKINSAARKSIQEDVDMLTNSTKYWEIKAERARTYFPIIEEIFAEEGVPTDLKYLVLQESALIADAVSSSNAVGFWQMKDFTAVELGLRVDRKIDERKNIVSSTYGAARYLKKSQETFDNWLNSLQSYQMGIGGAMKALGDKDQGANSMNITMRTYWYVRKFLAHYIAYGNVLERPASQRISISTAHSGKSFNELAKETGRTVDELKEYNKWLMHGRIPDDKAYAIVIPGDYASPEVTLAGKEKTERNTLPPFTDVSSMFPKIRENKHREHKYIIGVNGIPGIIASSTDNAMTLAQKGGISLGKFLKFNDLKTNNLIPGQVYYLKRKKRRAATHYHTVEPGESLWSVSQKYGIRLKNLLSKNRVEETEIRSIKSGRVLWLRFIRPEEIPVAYSQIAVIEQENTLTEEEVSGSNGDFPEEKQSIVEESIDSLKVIEFDSTVFSTPDPEEPMEELQEYEEMDYSEFRKAVHLVEQGETYYSISKTYEISVLDLLEWNELSIHDKLSIGQKLVVYTRKNPQPVKKTGDYILHTVKYGDTLYSISRAYDVSVPDILNWNNKTDSNIKIGEKLKIVSQRD